MTSQPQQPRTAAGRQMGRDWRQHRESCKARRGEWSPVFMDVCSCGQIDNILAIETEAASPSESPALDADE